MARKGGLGRGLGALIPRAVEDVLEEKREQTEQAEKKSAQKETKTEQKDTKAMPKPTSKATTTTKTTSKATTTPKTPSKATTTPKQAKKPAAKSPGAKKEEAKVEAVTKEVTTPEVETSKHDVVSQLPIAEIKPRFNQPRKSFDEESLQELSDSIRQFGVIQPIVVKEIEPLANGVKYEIIAGERRYRASRLAGYETIPAVLRNAKEEDAAMMSVVENVQREDLNALEEASAYQEIMNQQALTQQQLADILGKSRSYIANTLRLLKLDDETLDALRQGLITSTQARTLLSIESVAQRATYRKLLIEGRTNILDVEKDNKKAKVLKPRVKDIYVQEMEQRLAERLGTKVAIAKKRKGWTIQVQCYTEEDLDGFFQMLGVQDDES